MTGRLILETPRLVLREFLPTDAPFFYEMNLDPEVIRYTGDRPFTSTAEAEDFIRAYDQYKVNGYGRWSVMEKITGNYLGFCGLKFHPDTHETDLGYRLMRRYWGHGMATEASRACLAYGFKELGLTSIVGRVRQDNSASIRVLEKNGMRFWRHFDFEGHPGLIYRLTAEEWKLLNPDG
ncbi:MAG: GNAT family N-acetyltransferase [Lewinella sp.]|nr:GNAT family N-acetyltransferase [Lewinella sp.]